MSSRSEVARRLATLTAALTFILILIGGVVRLSDSGLGCGPAGSGTHGWPLCNGRFFPLSNGHTIIEYSHRAIAGIVTIAVLVLLIQVLRHLRENKAAIWLAVTALVLILLQAGLGGLTVEKNLDDLLVGVHLAVAMVFLAVLLALRKAIDPSPDLPLKAKKGVKGLLILSGCSLLITIGAGGYVAGTDGHGRVMGPHGGAHEACGDTFPQCNDSLLPFGQNRLTDIHLLHRVFIYLTVLLLLSLFVYSLAGVKDRRVTKWASIGIGILVLQVVLGGLQVWVEERAWLVFLHLLVATVLWSWLVLFWLKLAVPGRSDSGSQPLTAATP